MNHTLLRGLAAASTLVFAVLPALAQTGNPAGMAPGSADGRAKPPLSGNTTDQLFVKLVGMGNAGEVDAGRLADGKATNASVKAFARLMVQDHSSAAPRLAAAARPLGLAVPTEPDSDQRITRARLEGLQGAAFDSAYLQAQLIDHQKTVLLLEWEIGNGQDPGLQAFAKETLPVVMEHLRHVQELLAEVTGTGPQGLALDRDAPRRR